MSPVASCSSCCRTILADPRRVAARPGRLELEAGPLVGLEFTIRLESGTVMEMSWTCPSTMRSARPGSGWGEHRRDRIAAVPTAVPSRESQFDVRDVSTRAQPSVPRSAAGSVSFVATTSRSISSVMVEPPIWVAVPKDGTRSVSEGRRRKHDRLQAESRDPSDPPGPLSSTAMSLPPRGTVVHQPDAPFDPPRIERARDLRHRLRQPGRAHALQSPRVRRHGDRGRPARIRRPASSRERRIRVLRRRGRPRAKRPRDPRPPGRGPRRGVARHPRPGGAARPGAGGRARLQPPPRRPRPAGGRGRRARRPEGPGTDRPRAFPHGPGHSRHRGRPRRGRRARHRAGPRLRRGGHRPRLGDRHRDAPAADRSWAPSRTRPRRTSANRPSSAAG